MEDHASAIQIIRVPIDRKQLTGHPGRLGDLVKAVVDVERRLIAIGGALHADEEAALLQNGSRQIDLWGINLYPEISGPDFVEFDSLINIRPAQGNRSRSVEDESLRQRIVAVVEELLLD